MCCIPAISFKAINGIETLENYLKEAHSNNYRFNSKDWQKLIEDKLWNLNSNKIKESSKIWMATGKKDDQIKERDVIEFGQRNHIKVGTYDLGHITLSKIPNPMLIEILDFFSK